LKTLAVEPTKEPTGQAFSARSGIAVSSLYQSIKSLIEKDMLFTVKNTDEYVSVFKLGQVRVLNPLISFYLKQYV